MSLLCAFSLASADAATKRYLSDYAASELVVIRFAFAGILLVPALLLQPLPPLPAPFWVRLAVLVPLEILAMLLYMRAITTNPLANTVPYLAFTPVLSTLTGFVLLGERVSTLGSIGVLLVSVGAYALNFDLVVADGERSLLRPIKAILHETGPRLMLGVAVVYSVTSALGKSALQYVPASFFAPFYFSLLGVATLVIFSWTTPRMIEVIWRRPGPQLLVGLAMAAMAITHYLAIQRVEVAYMIAVKRTSLLFSILYGALIFKEPRLAQHLFAGVLMAAGVVLIAI